MNKNWLKQRFDRAVTLIEMLIVIAAMAILMGSVFSVFIMTIRLERGVTAQQLRLEELVTLEQAWRTDIHKTIRGHLQETSATEKRLLVLEQADPVAPRCEYQITQNPEGTFGVIRTRYGADGRPIAKQRLASDLTTVSVSQTREGAFVLEVATRDGFDAFHSTQQLTAYAVPDPLAATLTGSGKEEKR
ncbi:MAG: prepilin-type N-terminal cleavage/methylation domain-containing protein [Candidatus Hydrogenedentota bacterium]|jgi:prepilin-type N-terminal cleavage/methylation domain-containing protein|nr:MAG: prepilin-type N-terminal cleavage/methylation domain-containing protein [Candidatus Hydrogenedentota bacterium]GIX44165.1 MAG: hypothetical protein KatS3mg130_0573 [Candidatus Sumerlaea sp.]